MRREEILREVIEDPNERRRWPAAARPQRKLTAVGRKKIAVLAARKFASPRVNTVRTS